MALPTYRYDSAGTSGMHVEDRWWAQESPAPHLVAVVQALEGDQDHVARRNADVVYARLYENQELRNLYDSGLAVGLLSKLSNVVGERVTTNVIESCIDTAAAKIAKNKVRALFLTSGGDRAQQRRAKDLTKCCDGWADAHDFYAQQQEAFTDAGVWGTGSVKMVVEDGKVVPERTLCSELIVNPTEAVYGKPRTLYQKRLIYRGVLLDRYGDGPKGDKTARIASAAGVDIVHTQGRASEMIPVYEGWHLGYDGKGGRYVMAIDGCLLINKPWEKRYFPFNFFHWKRRRVGMWGMGIAEQLHGIQLEINVLLEKIRMGQDRGAVTRILLDTASKVDAQKIDNYQGVSVLKYTSTGGGQRPVVDTGAGVAPEIYTHYERLVRGAFEQIGISQMAANAKKPEGLDAAVAIREFHDIESERFGVVAQRYEQMGIDCFKMMLDMQRDLHRAEKKVSFSVADGKFMRKIDWKDVRLDEEDYVMRAYPVSILPTTPAGKLQKVQELYQAGFLPKEQALSLLDFPDLEGTTNLLNAAVDDIQRIIGKILDGDEYESPEPYMNLQLAVTMGQSAYLKARGDNVPEKRLELLRRFIDDCHDMGAQAAPPQPAQPQSGAPAPAPQATAPDTGMPQQQLPEPAPMVVPGQLQQ